MVKLAVEMMLKKNAGNLNDQERVSYLKKVTHLNLQDKNIDSIGSELGLCERLLVLYLYDNSLTQIPNITKNKHLQSLYLQNNKIKYIQNVEKHGNLNKIELGYNSISLLEGLEGLSSLEELHIEKQQLDAGTSLIIDPLCIQALSTTLRVVDVSSNGLEDIEAFKDCHKLEEFIAASNELNSLKDLVKVIAGNWLCVAKINFSNNPVCRKHRYRDAVINAAIYSIEFLDEKEVTELSKKFIQGFQQKIKNDGDLKKIKALKNNDSKPAKKSLLLCQSQSILPKNGAGDQSNEAMADIVASKKQLFSASRDDSIDETNLNVSVNQTVLYTKQQKPQQMKSHRRFSDSPEAPPPSSQGFYA